MNLTHTVFVGAMPTPDDATDVFGAHVGLTLESWHKLRYVRWMLERDLGASVTLLEALEWSIDDSYRKAAEAARHRTTDEIVRQIKEAWERLRASSGDTPGC